jgi:hypothetical protein
MADVDTLYGTFSENDLKGIKDALGEMSNEMAIIEGHKEAIKDIVDAIYDKYKLPKKIINRLAKAYHKQSFQEEIQLDNEFEAIYVGVTEAK